MASKKLENKMVVPWADVLEHLPPSLQMGSIWDNLNLGTPHWQVELTGRLDQPVPAKKTPPGLDSHATAFYHTLSQNQNVTLTLNHFFYQVQCIWYLFFLPLRS